MRMSPELINTVRCTGIQLAAFTNIAGFTLGCGQEIITKILLNITFTWMLLLINARVIGLKVRDINLISLPQIYFPQSPHFPNLFV